MTTATILIRDKAPNLLIVKVDGAEVARHIVSDCLDSVVEFVDRMYPGAIVGFGV